MRGVVGFVVCLGLLVACSDDSDPLDPGPDPIEFDVEGSWSYEALTLTDADTGATCTIDDATIELRDQDGDSFSGTATGRLTCAVEDQDWAWDREADVEDGSLAGSGVAFVFSDLNSQAERAEVEHEGTIDDDGERMSGTATLRYDDFELTGDWTATRD